MKYELNCFRESIELSLIGKESVQECLIREFGWLLKPIMEQTKCFEKAIEKLNWKIVKKDA
jgi:hypothetical protein